MTITAQRLMKTKRMLQWILAKSPRNMKQVMID